MSLVKTPFVSTALQFGEVSLQAATSENVFYQGWVYGRDNWTDEYTMGIDLGGATIRGGEEMQGYQIVDITEAGILHELKNTHYQGGIPWAFMQKQPNLLVERPHFMPVDIDVRDNSTIQAQYTDSATTAHMMQYALTIYIEYEELD